MKRTHIPALIAAFGLTVALAGCSDLADEAGHGDHGDNNPVAADAREIEVEATDLTFSPDVIDLDAGEDVSIVLTATDIEHDFVVDDIDFHVHADAGETATGGLTIDEPGTYTAYCSVPDHREAGMEATVTVTG